MLLTNNSSAIHTNRALSKPDENMTFHCISQESQEKSIQENGLTGAIKANGEFELVETCYFGKFTDWLGWRKWGYWKERSQARAKGCMGFLKLAGVEEDET
jgi:hypothetical protein